jgi:CDGSH-type Zn-finger protein
MAEEVRIQVRANGPYAVRGPFTLVDADGNAFTLEQESVALCRCGQSSNKPFCDSTHRTVGFDSSPKAR